MAKAYYPDQQHYVDHIEAREANNIHDSLDAIELMRAANAKKQKKQDDKFEKEVLRDYWQDNDNPLHHVLTSALEKPVANYYDGKHIVNLGTHYPANSLHYSHLLLDPLEKTLHVNAIFRTDKAEDFEKPYPRDYVSHIWGVTGKVPMEWLKQYVNHYPSVKPHLVNTLNYINRDEHTSPVITSATKELLNMIDPPKENFSRTVAAVYNPVKYERPPEEEIHPDYHQNGIAPRLGATLRVMADNKESPTVAAMAGSILMSGDHSHLPILADALEEFNHPLKEAFDYRHAPRAIAIDKAMQAALDRHTILGLDGVTRPLHPSWLLKHWESGRRTPRYLTKSEAKSIAKSVANDVSMDDVYHSLLRLSMNRKGRDITTGRTSHYLTEAPLRDWDRAHNDFTLVSHGLKQADVEKYPKTRKVKWSRVAKYSLESEEAGFHNVMHKEPKNTTHSLVYADWLEENGKPTTAKLIRNSVKYAPVDIMPVEMSIYAPHLTNPGDFFINSAGNLYQRSRAGHEEYGDRFNWASFTGVRNRELLNDIEEVIKEGANYDKEDIQELRDFVKEHYPEQHARSRKGLSSKIKKLKQAKLSTGKSFVAKSKLKNKSTSLIVSYNKSPDLIKGGKAAGKPDSAFDPVQLRIGTKVEQEHTDDLQIAKEIAKDHLTEDSNYYKKLRKVEKHERRGRTWISSKIKKLIKEGKPQKQAVAIALSMAKKAVYKRDPWEAAFKYAAEDHSASEFISKIGENPHDDTAHLVYADWLEEMNRPEEAEFIRKSISTGKRSYYTTSREPSDPPSYIWKYGPDTVYLTHTSSDGQKIYYANTYPSFEERHAAFRKLFISGVPFRFYTDMSDKYSRIKYSAENHTEDEFHRAIQENPEEHTNHLVYADWLKEKGRGAEAQFIRKAMEQDVDRNGQTVYPRIYGRYNAISNENSHLWIIQHGDGRPPTVGLRIKNLHEPDIFTTYKTSLSTSELKQYVQPLLDAGIPFEDEDARSDYEHEIQQSDTPQQYAAQKAPAGGMIVDNLFYPGGQIIPNKYAASSKRPWMMKMRNKWKTIKALNTWGG